MWELDHKENWVLKNWCCWTALSKIFESPLDCKEIQPVNPKGNQSWIFLGRTDTEAETPILWPPDVKNWLIGEDSWGSLGRKEIQPVHAKECQSWVFIGRTDTEAETPILWPPDANMWLIWRDPDAGKDWGQEEKGMTEDEMDGWHYRLDGREFEWTPVLVMDKGGLAFWNSWGRKESDTTEQQNWTDAKNWLIWKNPDAGKDWRLEEKGMTEDEMDGWYHRLNGYEFEQAPGVIDGQGSLECCSPCCRKEPDTTEQLNWLTDHVNASYFYKGHQIIIIWKRGPTVFEKPFHTFVLITLLLSVRLFSSLTT